MPGPLSPAVQALFALFSYFPYPMMLAVVAVFLILVFLSTSAASGAYVLGMMSTGGSLNPPRTLKLFWGGVIAALTAAVLFAGGGVQVLRAIAISGALPFTVIMIAQVACLLTSLSEEAEILREEIPTPEESEAAAKEVTS